MVTAAEAGAPPVQKASPLGGKGLFAPALPPEDVNGKKEESVERSHEATNGSTNDPMQYKPGDLILDETAPLIRLAPVADEEELALIEPLTSRKANGEDKQSLWDAIQVPEVVPTSAHSTFQGMVQAALVWWHRRKTMSTVEFDRIRGELLQLYHPSTTAESDAVCNDERSLMQLAEAASQYVALLIDKTSILTADYHEELPNIMLIWACNAFTGGRVYEKASRINHSCCPNAVVMLGGDNDPLRRDTSTNPERQCILAAAPIAAGQEILLSYLDLLVYADRTTRRTALQSSRHFDCNCERCHGMSDVAAAVPCWNCHGRTNGQQLNEDDQYDDDHMVAYAWPVDVSGVYVCNKCGTRFDSDCTASKFRMKIVTKVTAKIVSFWNDSVIPRATTAHDDDDEEHEQVFAEMLQDRLSLATSTLGALHWTTNLLSLVHLQNLLDDWHGAALEGGASALPNDDMLTGLATCIDLLQRVERFVRHVHLPWHIGHVVDNVVLSVARALVSLGDVKSCAYAQEWLDKLAGYEPFMSATQQAIAAAVRRKAGEEETDDASRWAPPPPPPQDHHRRRATKKRRRR